MTSAGKWGDDVRAMGRGFPFGVIVLLMLAVLSPHAQNPRLPADRIVIKGGVQTPTGEPLVGVSVVLERPDHSFIHATSDSEGRFILLADSAGTYVVRAEKPGWRTAVTPSLVFSRGEEKHLNFVLQKSEPSGTTNSTSASSARLPAAMELHDEPNFVVEAVTDGSNFGGHGSDTRLKTSETLTRDTLALKDHTPPISTSHATAPESMNAAARNSEVQLQRTLAGSPGSFGANHQLGSFYFRLEKYAQAIPLLEAAYRINPSEYLNAYELAQSYQKSGEYARARDYTRKILPNFNRAELHHLLADLDEQLDDPLGAVREYEEAVRLEPNEQNYFDWAAELLLHRASEPAAQVFAKGADAHPTSARLLAGLGTALYASGSYDEAARRLCAASDLNPTNTIPYILLGKMEKADSTAFPCAEQKLARFVHDQPENALANYYYAVTVWKRERGSRKTADLERVEALLNNAVKVDPKLDEALLLLGVVRAERGNFEEAIRAYDRALALNPRLGEAHYRLGLAYKRMGEESKAQEQFQLYQQVDKAESALLELQRREVRQYLITLRRQQ